MEATLLTKAEVATVTTTSIVAGVTTTEARVDSHMATSLRPTETETSKKTST